VKLTTPSKRPEHATSFGPGPVVAVLHVEGTMSDGDSLEIPLVGSKLAGSTTLVKQIDRLREDRRVKAVVVRIDSPGGSVAAAEAMTRALERTGKVKPVVVSMGNVAASGGYYVATAGQYIFSDALTRTGSIGIFRPKVDLSGTLKLFGVGVDEISVGAKAGMYSWWKPYSAEERAAAQAGIEASYRVFVQRVARARAMAPADVDRVARGRIWSGVRAQEIGLVDAYGGLREAVLHARALAGMGPRDGAGAAFSGAADPGRPDRGVVRTASTVTPGASRRVGGRGGARRRRAAVGAAPTAGEPVADVRTRTAGAFGGARDAGVSDPRARFLGTLQPRGGFHGAHARTGVDLGGMRADRPCR
jgi:signal peptide peptidase SppA